MSEIIKPKIYNIDRYVLASVLHKPGGKGPFPAVIVLAGFTGHKDEVQIKAIAEALADNGIVALRFDPTGFGESEGTVAEDYRISTYMNDIDTMYNYLSHQPFVKNGSIGLWGGSMGGMLAICFAAENPSTIKAVVAAVCPPFIGSSMWLKEDLAEWEKTGHYEIETFGYGTVSVPYDFIKDQKRGNYSALDSVKLLKQPIMVIAGTADDVVDPKETREIFLVAPEPKEYVEILGMNHDYGENPEHLNTVNEASVTFLRENL